MEVANKEELIHIVTLHHMVLKCKAELDQLKGGLQTLGVGDAMKAHPELFENFFMDAGHTSMTAGTIIMFFKC